jgi:hypothetical protein
MSDYMKELKKQKKNDDLKDMRDELCAHLDDRIRSMDSVELLRYYARYIDKDYLIFN